MITLMTLIKLFLLLMQYLNVNISLMFQMLLDQTDFLVVGMIGLQGSGKSTIMSFLAGNTDEDTAR